MESQTATGIATLVEMLNLQTRLFKNVVEGITEDHAQTRLNDDTNHIAWLTGHTVSSRYAMAHLAGLNEQEPYPDLFGKGKGIEDGTYPTLLDLTKDWDHISHKMIEAISNLPEATLTQQAPFQLPIGDPSMRGAFTFFAHHEAYTIGQIGIARRYFGYEAMKYA